MDKVIEKGEKQQRIINMIDFPNDDARRAFDDGMGKVSENDGEKILKKRTDINKKASTGPLEKFFDDIQLLFSMLKDYYQGNYTDIPWLTIAAIIFALTYVVNPFDLIPDAIPGIGLLDDAAVIALCLKRINSDLQKYKTWKETNG